MSFRGPHTLISVAFDLEGRIVERSAGFGTPGEVAQELYDRSRSPARGFEFGACLLAMPGIDPETLSLTVRDALALRLPASLAPYLTEADRLYWCRAR